MTAAYNQTMKNTINSEVRSLLLSMNREDSPRGLRVVEEYLTTLKLDPYYPLMNFESRKFNWKYFIGELWWYLSENTDINIINEFSSFWRDLVDEYNSVNSNYGYIINSRQNKSQFKWAYDALMADRSTRQAIMVFNTPAYQREGVKDFVCTMYVNFWIRDNMLNMKVQMRSNDIFYGLQYDAPFFSIIHQSMYLLLREKYDIGLGTYYHCSDNTHYYQRHFSLADQIKQENPNPNNDIQLRIVRPIFHFEERPIHSQYFVKFMESVEDFSELKTQDYINIFNKFFTEE
jgi:thymidylate synthase